MKHLIVLFVAALCLTIGAAGYGQPPHRHARHHAEKKQPRRRRVRRPVHPTTPRSTRADEVVLSPKLLGQLQRNLASGGYLDGKIDRRLTRRTRRAIAAFQRDYHLADTGALDRKTAAALLGYDVIGAYTIADAQPDARHDSPPTAE
jgi:peptidoglycan hydrolase-like protein with peptidoglycan-binding domain